MNVTALLTNQLYWRVRCKFDVTMPSIRLFWTCNTKRLLRYFLYIKKKSTRTKHIMNFKPKGQNYNKKEGCHSKS